MMISEKYPADFSEHQEKQTEGKGRGGRGEDGAERKVV